MELAAPYGGGVGRGGSFRRSAAAGPGVRECVIPRSTSIARPSIDDAGGANWAGRAEGHPVPSGKSASMRADCVPGGHAGGGGASVCAADGDACPMWRTAAPVESFERSFASPHVDRDVQEAIFVPSASLRTCAGLSTCFTTWRGSLVAVPAGVYHRMDLM